MPEKYKEVILFIVFSAVAVILVIMTRQTAANLLASLTPYGYLLIAPRAENTPTFTPNPTNTPTPSSTTAKQQSLIPYSESTNKGTIQRRQLLGGIFNVYYRVPDTSAVWLA